MDTLTNSSIAYRSLLHKCDDNVVDKIMEYHGNYNHWKSKFKESLIHIKKLSEHCLTLIYIKEKEEGRIKNIYECHGELFDDDCSNSICRQSHRIRRNTRLMLMKSLLRYLKQIK